MKRYVILSLGIALAISFSACETTKSNTVKKTDKKEDTQKATASVDEKPQAEEPAVQPNETDQAVTEEPAKDETVANETTEDETVANKPAESEPVAEEKKEPEKPQEPVKKENTYTVKKGDSLVKISEKLYGSYKRWPKIYRLNKKNIKRAAHIYPGLVLELPDKKE